jgi:hypothetical protein
LELTDTLPEGTFQSITGAIQDIFSQKIFRSYDLAALNQRYLFLSQNQGRWQSLSVEYFLAQIMGSRMQPALLANDIADQAFYFHSQFTHADLLESKEAVKKAVGRYSDELSGVVRDCIVARPDLSDLLFDTAQACWLLHHELFNTHY